MLDLNLINLGWFFFTSWTVTIAAVTLKLFGPDLRDELDLTKRTRVGHLK